MGLDRARSGLSSRIALASIGLFGLASYNVGRRTNEIGIRMALGTQRWDVTRMVLGESLTLVLLGVTIALGAAFAASRLIASLLFGLAPTDRLTISLAILVMIVVSSSAGYLPVARRSDDGTALRVSADFQCPDSEIRLGNPTWPESAGHPNSQHERLMFLRHNQFDIDPAPVRHSDESPISRDNGGVEFPTTPVRSAEPGQSNSGSGRYLMASARRMYLIRT